MHRGAAGYQAAYAVYPAENYGIGSKAAPPQKDGAALPAGGGADNSGNNPQQQNQQQSAALEQKMARRKRRYAQEGMRRTAEALLLVARHGHPHVLLAQHGPGHFTLPGGRVRPGEDGGFGGVCLKHAASLSLSGALADTTRPRPQHTQKNLNPKQSTDIDALKRKLAKQLSPDDASLCHPWEVGEVVGAWWRTGWDSGLLPYVPAHVTRPKEAVRLFFVALPERGFFAVPRDRRLVAVPLFELHENPGRYGAMLAAVPAMLSRVRLNVVAGTGGLAAAGAAGAAAGAGAAAAGGGQQPQDYDPYIA